MALITSGCVPFRYCLTGTSVYKKQELGLDKQLRCAAAAAAAALGSFGLHGTFFGGCVLRSNRPTDLEGPGLCRQQQLMLAGKKGAGGGKGYELQNEDEVCLPSPGPLNRRRSLLTQAVVCAGGGGRGRFAAVLRCEETRAGPDDPLQTDLGGQARMAPEAEPGPPHGRR